MKSTQLKKIASVGLALAAVALVNAASAEKRLTIATGPTSGVYFPLGAALAKILAASIPDTTATHEATSASVDNIGMVVAGKADVAFSQADTAWDAYKGYGKFEKPQPIRAIAVLYANNLQLVTLRDGPIHKVSDLRGKRVSTGPKGSGTEIWGNRLLQAAGLDPDKDITRESLGPTESAAALKDKKIDAFVWSSGVPTKAIADLAKDPAVKIQLLNTGSAVPAMLRKHGPVYTDGDIGANVYNGLAKPVPVAQVWNLLVVNADMNDKQVHDIVKALFEHKDDLIAAHRDAASLDMKIQGKGGSPIPFHSGAKKYYAEQGVRVLR